MLGCVVLLLAFAVVVMHQMGVGHQGMSAGSGTSAVHAMVPGAADMPDAHWSPAPMAEAAGSGCVAGCPMGDVDEAPMVGHGTSLVCLAVLPLLLLGLGRRRRTPLTRWQQLRDGMGALSRPRHSRVQGAGPPEPSLVRLCVSRT